MEFTKVETPADLEGGGRVRQAENETMEAEQFEGNRGKRRRRADDRDPIDLP